MFIFKKVVANFFSPISLTLELSFIGLFLLYFTSRQKTGKTLILTGVVILAFCSYTPTADILIKPLKERYPPYRYDNSLTVNQIPKLIVVSGLDIILIPAYQ